MIILTLRTDKPEAEIGLFDDNKKLTYESWEAHRQLAETLHSKIQMLLGSVNLDWKDIKGIVIYAGPGSFTGLRIGFSVANALAYSNGALIAACSGEKWLDKGIEQVRSGGGLKTVIPEYGMPAHITQQKK